MSSRGQLRDKVVVITGASSGVGRASANVFATEGAKVVVADIIEKPLSGGFGADEESSTAELIESNGGDAFFVKCDVTKAGDVDAVVQTAVERFGRLDVMFNNAGVYRSGKLLDEFTEEDLQLCFDVNVKGTFLGTQAAIRQFRKQQRVRAESSGTIVNLVSTAGLHGNLKQSVYNISKAAQANLTRCAALEYGPEGVRINGICPTFTKTALTRNLYDDTAFMESFADSVPLKRWGETVDVANLALFLASDASSYIHGALIPVDGGKSL
ncbi:SDR family oxidoreductase [Paenarthrobacter sp. AT5]|uniref:SDR family NAD(P)-dependent oxidoreductase n=1 Tax=Paenarthrobacter TaxID=1742992 RepID=UPI001A97F61F|nr:MULTISPECIES: SDR family oxidoreductase [Paenarthrobacter]QSZ53925.1 oxidoreductase [Paenarthrobacter ureafaciens]WOC62706.1 SDR family oxidoreductase [Paenarthrobacter sp. AT5]